MSRIEQRGQDDSGRALRCFQRDRLGRPVSEARGRACSPDARRPARHVTRSKAPQQIQHNHAVLRDSKRVVQVRATGQAPSGAGMSLSSPGWPAGWGRRCSVDRGHRALITEGEHVFDGDAFRQSDGTSRDHRSCSALTSVPGRAFVRLGVVEPSCTPSDAGGLLGPPPLPVRCSAGSSQLTRRPGSG